MVAVFDYPEETGILQLAPRLHDGFLALTLELGKCFECGAGTIGQRSHVGKQAHGPEAQILTVDYAVWNLGEVCLRS